MPKKKERRGRKPHPNPLFTVYNIKSSLRLSAKADGGRPLTKADKFTHGKLKGWNVGTVDMALHDENVKGARGAKSISQFKKIFMKIEPWTGSPFHSRLNPLLTLDNIICSFIDSAAENDGIPPTKKGKFTHGPLKGTSLNTIKSALRRKRIEGAEAFTTLKTFKNHFLPGAFLPFTKTNNKQTQALLTADNIRDSMILSKARDGAYPTLKDSFSAGPLEGVKCRSVDVYLYRGKVAGTRETSLYRLRLSFNLDAAPQNAEAPVVTPELQLIA